MRRGKSARNGSGLTDERLGLVHRYMVEAPPEQPRKAPRWTPARREPVAGTGVAPRTKPGAPQIRRADEQSSRSAPAPVQAPVPPPPAPAPALEEASSANVVSLRREPAADAEPAPGADAESAVPEEQVASPAAAEEAEVLPVEAPPEAALAPEPAAETEEEAPEAADLPIHLWVRAPGASAAEADPDWPQELVRLGLERSRSARRSDRDDYY